MRLLDNLKNYRFTEYLFKLGLTKIAASAHVSEMKGENAAEVLNVAPQYIPMLCRINASWFELNIIKASRTWVSEDMLAKFRTLRLEGYLNDTIDILGDMSFERFVNYFTRQKAVAKWKNSGQLLTWYRDYISMSRALEVDLSHKSVRFPKDLKAAHDLIVPRFNEVKHAVEDINFAHATEKLYEGMTEYANDGYLIVFPTKRSQFITEGQALNHCVGTETYYKRHLEGLKMIFFVRREELPDKPFYTMEVDMRALKITQLYGFGNTSVSTEVRKFANAFLRKLKPEKVVAEA